MKKRSLIIALVIICFISISINVILVNNYNNAKKEYLFAVYTHLANISKVFDNMAYSPNDTMLLSNYLESECIQLDGSILGLCTLSQHNLPNYRFEDFYKMISIKITANGNNPEKIKNDATLHKEKIQELIKKLSPKGEISDNGYGGISLTPNYSLNINQIINSINDTLADMPLRENN